MKAKELHELTVDELNTKLKELSEELFNLRFRHAIGQLENPASLKNVKKEIAKIKTILRERELAAKA
jgi:large subunit ribosomal protein L29